MTRLAFNRKSPTIAACKALLCEGVAAAAILAPLPAFAQDAGESASGSEIVVTANRREEKAQDVPIAITAMSADRLQQQSIAKEQDLQASVPGLVV